MGLHLKLIGQIISKHLHKCLIQINLRDSFEKPNIKIDQKIINLSISNESILVKNVSIGKPNPKIVRDTFLRKDDMYGLEFYDQNNEVIYRLGLGDPFIVRMQHIDMEEREHFSFEAQFQILVL